MAPKSEFGNANEAEAQPVNLLGQGVELALNFPTNTKKRDAVALAYPGATGETIVGAANPLPVSSPSLDSLADTLAPNPSAIIQNSIALSDTTETELLS